MPRFGLLACICVTAVLILRPPTVLASLTLSVESKNIAFGTSPLRIIIKDAPGEPEQIVRYQVKLDMQHADFGVHFVGTQVASADPLFPGVSPTDLGSDIDTVFVSGELPPGQAADVLSTGNTVFDVLVNVPPGAADISYPIIFDPVDTAFFDASGARYSFEALDGGVSFPEPTAAAIFVAVTAPAALRRGRVHA